MASESNTCPERPHADQTVEMTARSCYAGCHHVGIVEDGNRHFAGRAFEGGGQHVPHIDAFEVHQIQRILDHAFAPIPGRPTPIRKQRECGRGWAHRRQ
jgi:hypothetical protein